MKIELSVIVPLRNERECLPSLLDRLKAALLKCTEHYELLFVDDGSSDESWSFLRKSAESDSHIRGIRFSRGFGKEAAMRAGLAHCRGQAAVIMDSDLQHPPELIPQMFEAWRSGGALVVQAVKDRGASESMVARFGGYLVYRCLRKLTGFDFDGSCDFKLLDRAVINQIVSLPEKITFLRGMVTWLGHKTVDIPFTPPPRTAGSTNWSLFRLTSLAIDALTGFSGAALRLVTLASAAFLLFAGILILQTLFNFLTGAAVEGFTTVIIVVLIVGSVLALGLGVIGEYLARIFDEIKKRPEYVIGEKLEDSAV